MKYLRLFVLLSQLAVSIVTPLLLCILGSRWLMLRFSLGQWVMAVGVFLGLAGAISGLVNIIRQLQKEADREDKNNPISFNDHE